MEDAAATNEAEVGLELDNGGRGARRYQPGGRGRSSRVERVCASVSTKVLPQPTASASSNCMLLAAPVK